MLALLLARMSLTAHALQLCHNLHRQHHVISLQACRIALLWARHGLCLQAYTASTSVGPAHSNCSSAIATKVKFPIPHQKECICRSRIFVIGPSHHVYTKHCLLSPAASYSTPQGMPLHAIPHPILYHAACLLGPYKDWHAYALLRTKVCHCRSGGSGSGSVPAAPANRTLSANAASRRRGSFGSASLLSQHAM